MQWVVNSDVESGPFQMVAVPDGAHQLGHLGVHDLLREQLEAVA